MIRAQAAALVDALDAYLDARLEHEAVDPVTAGAGEIRGAALAEVATRLALIDALVSL